MCTNRERLKNIYILAYLWLLVLNLFCVAMNEKKSGMFYVLMWTNSGREPFYHWSRGSKSLIFMNCIFQNCYLTDEEKYFLDPKDYDAILFNSPNINNNMRVPSQRSEKQIYVFVSTESESYYPISEKFNDFFNYTWSYKLNSDVPLPYFYVKKKKNGNVIAPKINVNWKIHMSMKATPKVVIQHLQNKSTCAAWFVSNCRAKNGRLNYVQELRAELQKLGQQLDIFGFCDANKKCEKAEIDDCFEMLKNSYFFYLAFENSFSEDYVTEKLLTAVSNYAVPVVYGGANYSRFLPDGAYLDGRLYAPRKLAVMMDGIIKNKQDYYNFFKFHRYYTYHAVGESVDIDPFCNFCKFINNYSEKNKRNIYHLFSQWWHNNSGMPAIKASAPVPEPKDEVDVSGSLANEKLPQWRDPLPTLPDEDSDVIKDIIYYFLGRK